MGTTEILTVWESATASQMEEGLNWYGEAHDLAHEFAERYSVTFEMAAGVIAAMSPNASWVTNVAMAESILAGSPKGLANGVAKCERILNGEAPETVLASDTYFKVLNFYYSITSRGIAGITIDRHAWDVYTGIRHADKSGAETSRQGGAPLPIRPKVAGKRYVEAAQAYEEAAEILSARGESVTAGIVQSVTWVVWRERYWSKNAYKIVEG